MAVALHLGMGAIGCIGPNGFMMAVRPGVSCEFVLAATQAQGPSYYRHRQLTDSD